ncbi:glycosyltransferase family 4 protein [Aeromicrobium chenweiae]|uniref:Glycosyl transferase group 1 n=1 Tax=Aeromicrobium chenweiae TaxID=2079793 RepID=A0A2S0WJH0_9ACTN|nr:glycosyltransferase family 4 protein [Aeromicrobium chenweiae]AWB91432.1 glycosyl transferase group 1 [Aeromicrobium chenweiae]TGN30637.1 glycosyltransferase family 1 protein [Aeromicrobium chenweiae]
MNVRGATQKLRHEGPAGLARRIVRRAHDRLGAGALDFPLLPGDIADSGSLPAVTAGKRSRSDGPLTIGWLSTPPSAGSGGHTTMFRMIRALEDAGHTCVLFLYDRHHGDLTRHAEVVAHSWPWVGAEVRDASSGWEGVDAVVATSWPTAHVLARRGTGLHRLYFVQDYEPFFFPRGSEHELAADTYRFGFTNIALGTMVHDRLRHELGVSSHVVPFSCDTNVYSLEHRGARSGVVFYAKPDVPRRGYLLGMLALEEFHRRHPEHPIHVYGEAMPEVSFPVIRHGRLTPDELNLLYNQTVAGLAMSFTNISLVAEEMLASGTIPVVPDLHDARADLPNDEVAWSPPTPAGLARALCRAVEDPDVPGRAVRAAASVRTDNWQEAGRAVVRIIEDTALTAGPPQVSWEASGPSSPAPPVATPAPAAP